MVGGKTEEDIIFAAEIPAPLFEMLFKAANLIYPLVSVLFLYVKEAHSVRSFDLGVIEPRVVSVLSEETNLHKNSIYKPVEIKNQIPFPRVFAKMRI